MSYCDAFTRHLCAIAAAAEGAKLSTIFPCFCLPRVAAAARHLAAAAAGPEALIQPLGLSDMSTTNERTVLDNAESKDNH